ncbi:hypothetical protein ABID39_001398 [Bartonella japonica]|uniref:Phage holin family protein n=1 Tax=Bartonella japonica TaxID=357761 RepID=A0ABV2FQF6_9HYPH
MNMFIAPLLNHLIGGGIKSTTQKIRFQAICGIVIGVSLFMSLIFLCITGFIALCSVMKPLAAASVLFFIWLFISGLGILFSKFSNSIQRYDQQKKAEEQRHQLITDATVSGIAMLSKHLPFSKLSVPVLGLATYFLWKKDKKDRLFR